MQSPGPICTCIMYNELFQFWITGLYLLWKKIIFSTKAWKKHFVVTREWPKLKMLQRHKENLLALLSLKSFVGFDLPLREKLQNNVIIVWSHILRNVHEVWLWIVSFNIWELHKNWHIHNSQRYRKTNVCVVAEKSPYKALHLKPSCKQMHQVHSLHNPTRWPFRHHTPSTSQGMQYCRLSKW
jgi:hypothetical protein